MTALKLMVSLSMMSKLAAVCKASASALRFVENFSIGIDGWILPETLCIMIPCSGHDHDNDGGD